MKNVLVFGLANAILRKKIEYYLNDEYSIIGYTDLQYDEDILQGQRFISVSEILNHKIYAIILCSDKNEEQEKMREYINNINFDGEIIDPIILYKSDFVYVPDLVFEIDRNIGKIQGLIMGMSYSMFGVDENYLNGNWMNLSYRGTDFYYNIELCNRVINKHKEVKRIMLVMPYYYFDYDMSQLPFEYSSGQIFAVRKLGWHTANNINVVNGEILNYILCDNLFGEKFFSINRGNIFFSNKNKRNPFYNGKLSNLWKSYNHQTREENIRLFNEFLWKLNKKKVTIDVVIPPLYYKCISKEDRKNIDRKKEEFYLLLDEFIPNINNIYDYFDIYENNMEFFWDYEHLNYLGKEEFTKLIERII